MQKKDLTIVKAPSPAYSVSPPGNITQPIVKSQSVAAAAATTEPEIKPVIRTVASESSVQTANAQPKTSTGDDVPKNATDGKQTNGESANDIDKMRPTGKLNFNPNDINKGASLDYATMIKMLDAEREDKEKRNNEKTAKQRKRMQLLAALGDGISSLANLYYTTKGANSAYDSRTSLSKKAQERYDKLDELAKADKEKRIAYILRERAQRREDDYRSKVLAQHESARQDALEAKRQAAQQEAARWAATFGNKEKIHDDEMENKRLDRESRERIAEKNRQNKREVAVYRTSHKGSSGGSSGKLKYKALDRDGNEHWFSTVNEADNYAKAHGTYVPRNTTTKKDGTSFDGTTKTTVTGGYRQTDKGSAKSWFSIHKSSFSIHNK